MLEAALRDGLKVSYESGEYGIADAFLPAEVGSGAGLTDFRTGVRGSGLMALGFVVGTDERCGFRT